MLISNIYVAHFLLCCQYNIV